MSSTVLRTDKPVTHNALVYVKTALTTEIGDCLGLPDQRSTNAMLPKTIIPANHNVVTLAG